MTGDEKRPGGRTGRRGVRVARAMGYIVPAPPADCAGIVPQTTGAPGLSPELVW